MHSEAKSPRSENLEGPKTTPSQLCTDRETEAQSRFLKSHIRAQCWSSHHIQP
jgi:hypothetical protein